MDIRIEKTTAPKAKYTDEGALGFGQIFTDHMFVMDYDRDNGWHDARIVPEAGFSLSPAAMVYHYGQATFEGLKAYKWADGSIAMFRPEENFMRMTRSNARVCMPGFEGMVDEMVDALKTLVDLEKDWIPGREGTSLYIRPTTIAVDPFLGVRPSNKYIFFIILSPVGAYYKGGLAPTTIYVEHEYTRAVKGGLGEAKTAANYAASLIASDKAKKNGADQVLWLDGVEKKYIEEVGSMNIFFKINGEIVTPELNGSILPGITRKSVLAVAKDMGLPAVERRVSIDEVIEGCRSGALEECFGSGTAAVISPVGKLIFEGEELVINGGQMGETTKKLYDTITGIQYGKIADTHGWIVKL